MSDPDLLRRYAQDGAADAFSALVHRHVDLVYSVARRHVPSASTAEEVAQSVFIELARHARKIKPGTPLVAWLHVVARRTAINAVRDTTRRHAREQIAAEIAAMKSPDSVWSGIEPLLDEAVESLPEPDRAAILLRFFENKSLREVGASLGTSDDAAQKRIGRALVQLRTFFLRRGVEITAAGLVTELSAHALQTVPITLGASISAKALMLETVLTKAGAAQVAGSIVSTTAKKTLAALSLAAAIGAVLYESQTIYSQRQEMRIAREQTESLLTEVRKLRLQSSTTAKSASARNVTSLSSPELDAEMRAWLERVEDLKGLFKTLPEQSIPEIALLTQDSWLALVKEADFTDRKKLQATLREVRRAAKGIFALKLGEALREYLIATNGSLPTDMQLLAPHFDPPIDAAIVQRYEMTVTGKFDERSANKWVAAEKLPVREGDKRIIIGLTEATDEDELFEGALERAGEEFAATHGGQRATQPAELEPYLSPSDKGKLPQYFERLRLEASP